MAFGGLSPKNSAVASGGIGRHTMAPALASAVARGCRLVSVSPLRTDTDASLGAEWIAPVPGTDADPQPRADQVRRLGAAGVIVAASLWRLRRPLNRAAEDSARLFATAREHPSKSCACCQSSLAKW